VAERVVHAGLVRVDDERDNGLFAGASKWKTAEGAARRQLDSSMSRNGLLIDSHGHAAREGEGKAGRMWDNK
jgi:hypothetical protein